MVGGRAGNALDGRVLGGAGSRPRNSGGAGLGIATSATCAHDLFIQLLDDGALLANVATFAELRLGRGPGLRR